MKRKYRVISIVQTSNGVWEVQYKVWLGCPGNAKYKTAYIHKERKPLLGDLMKEDAKYPI